MFSGGKKGYIGDKWVNDRKKKIVVEKIRLQYRRGIFSV